jgi:hypothetical protein
MPRAYAQDIAGLGNAAALYSSFLSANSFAAQVSPIRLPLNFISDTVSMGVD